MTTATVVGSGPNGLAAAITLAQRGVAVTVLEAADRPGGGTRTTERTLPGLLHDQCSAFHPTGVASPFLRSLGLEEEGLVWRWPEIQVAHPLDGDRAGLLHRDLARTSEGLGRDGPAWARTFGPLVQHADRLVPEILQPVLHVPRHPVVLARFGLRALPPASWLARRWHSNEARGLFAGIAAHAVASLRSPLSSAVGVMLATAGHAYGWPVAEGGSRAITDAMLRRLERLGGVVKTGVTVASLDDLDPTDAVVLSVAPRAAVDIVGTRMPARVRRAYRRYRYGPGAFKVDLAVEGAIPWQHPDVGRAGTVHLGGTFEEVAAAEDAVVRGQMPARPVVLVGQQAVADPTRAADDLHPVWAYAHVPAGFRGDATDAVLDQLERFAPGVRGRIRAVAVRGTDEMQAYNPNYVGGDINVGANTPRQLVLRPRATTRPYRTGAPGVWICSSATPPGSGVHGMCGHNAALDVLARTNVGVRSR